MSNIIRISSDAKAKIAAIARSTGRPMTDVIDDAVQALERQVFFNDLNRRFAELRADPETWSEIEAERREWEQTLGDDLYG